MRKYVAVLLAFLFLVGCYRVERVIISEESHVWMPSVVDGNYGFLDRKGEIEYRVVKSKKDRMYLVYKKDEEPKGRPMFVRSAPLSENVFLVQYWFEGDKKMEMLLDVFAVTGYGTLSIMPDDWDISRPVLKRHGIDRDIDAPLEKVVEAMSEVSEKMKGEKVREVLVNVDVYGSLISQEFFARFMEDRRTMWLGNI